jgi:hypothetical protein
LPIADCRLPIFNWDAILNRQSCQATANRRSAIGSQSCHAIINRQPSIGNSFRRSCQAIVNRQSAIGNSCLCPWLFPFPLLTTCFLLSTFCFLLPSPSTIYYLRPTAYDLLPTTYRLLVREPRWLEAHPPSPFTCCAAAENGEGSAATPRDIQARTYGMSVALAP